MWFTHMVFLLAVADVSGLYSDVLDLTSLGPVLFATVSPEKCSIVEGEI